MKFVGGKNTCEDNPHVKVMWKLKRFMWEMESFTWKRYCYFEK